MKGQKTRRFSRTVHGVVNEIRFAQYDSESVKLYVMASNTMRACGGFPPESQLECEERKASHCVTGIMKFTRFRPRLPKKVRKKRISHIGTSKLVRALSNQRLYAEDLVGSFTKCSDSAVLDLATSQKL